MKHKHEVPVPKDHFESLPRVTIQLPIFNEMYVVERLIDAVCAHRLPARPARDPGARRLHRRDRGDRPRSRATSCAAEGIDIEYIHRDQPRGLQGRRARARACKQAKGEFVAIFDADFVPHADFLRRRSDYFTDAKVGDGAGPLGPPQPRLLAAHPRSRRSSSTATSSSSTPRATAAAASSTSTAPPASGGAPRSTTPAAGSTTRSPRTSTCPTARSSRAGSSSSCPTSCRPAELPVEMNAFKSQQHRWAKGSIQTARSCCRASCE